MEIVNEQGPAITIDDVVEVIDLDCNIKPSEEIVKLWDERIRRVVFEEQIYQKEKGLNVCLGEYIRSLENEGSIFEDKLLLKKKILSHINFINLCYSDVCLETIEMAGYWDNMVEILTYYCNLELLCASYLKRERNGSVESDKLIVEKWKNVAEHMCMLLTFYLMNSQKQIFHVLIKMNYDVKSPACRAIMDAIYWHFMIILPQTDDTEEAFCRYYLVFQKWKCIRKKKYIMDIEKSKGVMEQRFPNLCLQKVLKDKLKLDPRFSIADYELKYYVMRYFHYIKDKEVTEVIEIQEDRTQQCDDIEFVSRTVDEAILINNEDNQGAISSQQVKQKRSHNSTNEDHLLDQILQTHFIFDLTRSLNTHNDEKDQCEVAIQTIATNNVEQHKNSENVELQQKYLEENLERNEIIAEEQREASKDIAQSQFIFDLTSQETLNIREHNEKGQCEVAKETIINNNVEEQKNSENVEKQLKSLEENVEINEILVEEQQESSKDIAQSQFIFDLTSQETLNMREHNEKDQCEVAMEIITNSNVEQQTNLGNIEKQQKSLEESVERNEIIVEEQQEASKDIAQSQFIFDLTSQETLNIREHNEKDQCEVAKETIINNNVEEQKNSENVEKQLKSLEENVEINEILVEEQQESSKDIVEKLAKVIEEKPIKKIDKVVKEVSKLKTTASKLPIVIRIPKEVLSQIATSKPQILIKIPNKNSEEPLKKPQETKLTETQKNLLQTKQTEMDINRVAIGECMEEQTGKEQENALDLAEEESGAGKIDEQNRKLAKRKLKHRDRFLKSKHVTCDPRRKRSKWQLDRAADDLERDRNLREEISKLEVNMENQRRFLFEWEGRLQNQHNNDIHSGTVEDFQSKFEDKVFPPLNLPTAPSQIESDFQFHLDSQSLTRNCLVESHRFPIARESLLSNNSDPYTNKIVSVPQVLPPLQSSHYVFCPENGSNSSTNENNNDSVGGDSLSDLNEKEIKLPFKKRRMSVVEPVEREISYPAKRMISLAEIKPLIKINARRFKTPAERKECPPMPAYFDSISKTHPVFRDWFNINHQTFNTGNINCHTGNVPFPLNKSSLGNVPFPMFKPV